jgi:trafficking protein particle complex subunit 9
MAVIGVASCSQIDSMKSLYSQFDASLGDIFSPEGVYPLVKNCFVFEETEGTENFDPGETFPGLIVVPRIMNRKLHIGTLLGVICSQILAEFGVLVGLFFFVIWIYINDSLDSNSRKPIRE